MLRFVGCLLLCLAVRGQAPFTIIAVERRGLPPYEESQRFYRLDGGEGRGLKVGDHLAVRRPGEGSIGLLKIVEVRADWAVGVVDGPSHAAPMKGDLALKAELEPLPALPPLRDPDLALPAPPRAAGAEAPPREGLLWFLPGSAVLSPAGQAKLAGWVEAWGQGGRWALVVGIGGDAPLREARGRALREALRGLGVAEAAIQLEERRAEGANHPAWVQHWE